MSAISMTKEFSAIDVVPVALARPILTPPRSFNDQPDAPLYAYRCPFSGDIKLIDEALTIWPHLVMSDSLPVVLRLGQAIFIGQHLLKPDKAERLKAVLGRVYEDDRTWGHTSRWHDSRAVTSAWQPATSAPEPRKLFAQYRPKPPVKKPMADLVPA